jgi:P27 family predicted phage terminase small subunit
MARPNKPTSLKLVEGNRGKRGAPKQEPDPEYLNDLEPPPHLDAAAAAVWKELAPKLRAQRLLTVLDIIALGHLCTAEAKCRLAIAQVGDDLVVKSSQGGYSMNQLLSTHSMLHKQVSMWCREFGMTPAARTRIALQPQGDLFDEKQSGTSGSGYF